jgi:hypothetical protein
MKRRWIGITGLAFITTALLLGLLGPSLWPSAFWNSRYSGMIGPGMMSGGMIGPGMMNGGTIGPGMMSGGMMGGGMMSGGMMGGGMMSGGMMSGEVAGDSGQPFDQRFLDQMIMHHQGAIRMARILQASNTDPELEALADSIISAQSAEIEHMNELRAEHYGGPTPSGGVPSDGDGGGHAGGH